MNTEPEFERCLSFIHCQLHPAKAVTPLPAPTRRWRAVTISRQAGAGGHSVAEVLAGLLQARQIAGSPPWTVFDRNLMERVLEDHHLPSRLAKFMLEDRVSEIGDAIEDLCGLHPPTEALVEKTAVTIRHLMELGNVIIVGRGANVIAGRLDYVFHVRLVGSMEKRAERIQSTQQLGKRAALEFIHREDVGRRRYLRKYYDRDIEDPLLYHLVINTDLISHEQAARMIADTLLSTRSSVVRSEAHHPLHAV